MDIFYYIPLELWKEIAKRFLDPTSFGRLRQTCHTLKDSLDEECKKKMVKRCTLIVDTGEAIETIFLNRKHMKLKRGGQGEYWFRDGKLHRDNDYPAYISDNGTIHWCQNGSIHRDNDYPAIINMKGEKYLVSEWFDTSW